MCPQTHSPQAGQLPEQWSGIWKEKLLALTRAFLRGKILSKSLKSLDVHVLNQQMAIIIPTHFQILLLELQHEDHRLGKAKMLPRDQCTE